MRLDTVILSDWSVIRHTTGDRLVGFDVAEGCGRISSPLVSVYTPGRLATTESGRASTCCRANAV